MKEYPGCSWQPIVYADDSVLIRFAGEGIVVYKNVAYNKPLSGNLTSGWLQSKPWGIGVDGRWYQRDGLGGVTGIVAETIDDVVSIVKGE